MNDLSVPELPMLPRLTSNTAQRSATALDGTTDDTGNGVRVHSGGLSSDEAGFDSPEAKDAVLRGLYEERAGLLTQKRLGKLSVSDQHYLADIETEINHLEEPEGNLRNGHLWSQIDDLAARIVAAGNSSGV